MTTTPPQLSEIARQLPVMYAEIDRQVAAVSPVCIASGRCCRFGEYGHMLYMTRPEAELMMSVPWTEEGVVDWGVCPYQVQNLCTARDRRPSACRIFHCDPNFAGHDYTITDAFIDKLKKLHEETGTPWDYQHLHIFVMEVDEARKAQASSASPPASSDAPPSAT